MGLLMDESARRSYDADREDLRGRLVSPALSRHEGRNATHTLEFTDGAGVVLGVGDALVHGMTHFWGGGHFSTPARPRPGPSRRVDRL